MSLHELFEDVTDLNFSHAWSRVKDWWDGMPSWLKDFAAKVHDDADAILEELADAAAKDIEAGGLTTDSFVAAAKDVESRIVEKGLPFIRQEIFAAINLAVAALLKTKEAAPVSEEPAA